MRRLDHGMAEQTRKAGCVHGSERASDVCCSGYVLSSNRSLHFWVCCCHDELGFTCRQATVRMCCWLHRSSREWHGFTDSAFRRFMLLLREWFFRRRMPAPGWLHNDLATIWLRGPQRPKDRHKRRAGLQRFGQQRSAGLKLQPCLPLQLQLPHSDRYEIQGVIGVIGGPKEKPM